MRIFRFRRHESSDARHERAAYRCAMVTHKAALGSPPCSEQDPVEGAERHQPLPPPARARRLERGRASSFASHSIWRRLRGIFLVAGGKGAPSKEKPMDALLTNGSGQLPPGSEPEKRSPTAAGKTARAATVFAAIYLALALGSPLIVRYAPSADDQAMAAFATRIEQPRCTTAPGRSGASCR
jgi:hypothetical protein